MTTKNLIIPEDYKDFVYRITYYFLGKFAHRVPANISPNQITCVAFFSALLGTALLYFVHSPVAYIYWLVFNFVWYILDALDGIHARLSKQTSEYGAFLDHAFDNLYFIFMFTAFAVKFDLMYPLYIFIICMRFTAATMVFLVQCHTKRIYLTTFSGGTELLLFSAVMMLSFLYPHFNPVLHTSNPVLLRLIDWFSLQQGAFMKLALLFYGIAVPIVFVMQFHFVKKEISRGAH